MCTHDFSIVTFATELSTNLVYNSICHRLWLYIYFHLLFFFIMKLSIFSRLCVTHKRVMIRSTHIEVYKFNTALVSDQYRYWQMLRNSGIGLGSVLKKWHWDIPTLEACVLQVNNALLYHPKEAQNHFHRLFINCSYLVEWPARLNLSSWILSHLQETAKKHISSIFIWPSNSCTFYSNSVLSIGLLCIY